MSGQSITFDLKAPIDLEGALIEMVVRPDTAFVASGASLQVFAQVKGKLSEDKDWPGEWNCWTSNANLQANVDQTLSCLVNENGTFSQTQFDVQVGIQAARGAGEPQTAAGTVLVKSTKVTLAANTSPSSSSAPASSSSSSNGGVVVPPSSSSSSAPASSASSSSTPSTGGGNVTAPISDFITVDQFGYLPNVQKVAVVRDPQIGFDAALSFTPGNSYQLVNYDTGAVVNTFTPVAWNSGAISPASGDKTWWVDFSSVTTPGTYTLVDTQRGVRSPTFKIANDVYKPVLKHAVRYFYYQRAGFAKDAAYAGAGWTDTASHLKPGQDKQSRLFTDKNNASTEKDLSGGWYDAGDYNKYTNWHADYLIGLLHVYMENPTLWTDDFNIPESGNGIPDLIDEIKWGFDWLIKMQNSDGSVLSIQGLSGDKAPYTPASPPSTAIGNSYYGPASTSATLGSAAAFALGAKVLGEFNEFASYANSLKSKAESAWTWANQNPDIRINNNRGIYAGLGAGDQEICADYSSITYAPDRAIAKQRCDEGMLNKKVRAAIYLYSATGGSSYHNFVKDNFGGIGYWVSLWNEEYQLMPWLHYASLPNADTTIARDFKSRYNSSVNNDENFTAITSKKDAYRVYLTESTIGEESDKIQTYGFTWGSNRSMSRKGSVFMNLITYGVGTHAASPNNARNAAVGYLNYLHGTNPLSRVYLSNMYDLGVYQSVNEFYHTWFTHGSTNWDRVGVSVYGPPPGFLVGGPNPAYSWETTECPSNPVCGEKMLSPPTGQPAMKSYLEFNDSWPLNSWEVTENHNDYQVAYIRLLARFVNN